MADNFDLRQFLTENKLTENAKLLNEAVTLDGKPVDVGSIEIDDIDTKDYPDFSDAYIAYAEFEDGTPLTEEELIKLEEENYGIVGELIFDRQLYMEGEGEVEEVYQPKSKLEQVIQAAWAEKDLNKAKQIVIDLIEPSRVKSKDQILQTIKGIQNKARFDQYLANSLLKFEKLGLSEETENVSEGGNWGITLDGRPVDVGSIEIDGMDPADRPDYSDAYIAYAEFEDGTELTPQEIDRLQDENYGIIHDLILHRGLDEAAKPKETVKESTLSPREKYLTRLVENALGLEGYGDDNVISKLEKRGKELPERPTYSEGEEMVTEKPVPSYKSIEELMKEIDHGTNEAACKYKMEEMKRIAQALEEKVSSLEEGEGADFVDSKKVKQMKKDIMTLRKQAEKLEKEYDKKFGEKKPKKEEN
jgi:hypothetical protein